MKTIKSIILTLVLSIITIYVSNSQTKQFDFENYKIDNFSSDWSMNFTGKKGEKCHWNIIDDSGNKVIAQLTKKNPGYHFNVIANNNINYKDVEISVKFKGIEGEEDQGGGPVWRYIDENNYYIARANPLEDNYRLYKVVDGNRKELKSANIEIKTNQWYNIKIIMKGDNIKCYFNDKLELETKDKTFTKAGKIGLWTKADAVTYFDNLKVKNLGK
jgi:hypothetical protein